MPSKKSSQEQLRLRVFAGPNGSGKTTIIRAVMQRQINGRRIDLGYYINADDITQALRTPKGFSFGPFRMKLNEERFHAFAQASGLLYGDFTFPVFTRAYQMRGNALVLNSPTHANKIGQVIARFLREEMLRLRRRFSFETVFSHASNLDIMRAARDAGYKVYLYFVSTESPEINVYRVQVRVTQNGHDVPPDTIRNRYERSLGFAQEAATLCYQAFFFDNSGEEHVLTAHFKREGKKVIWDKIARKHVAKWFTKFVKRKEIL